MRLDEENHVPHSASHHAPVALAAALIPGFGQFYNRQWAKGIIFFIILFCFAGGYGVAQGLFPETYGKDAENNLSFSPVALNYTGR